MKHEYYFFYYGLFNMCNIAHFRATEMRNILLKNNNYLCKNVIFNIRLNYTVALLSLKFETN